MEEKNLEQIAEEVDNLISLNEKINKEIDSINQDLTAKEKLKIKLMKTVEKMRKGG